MRVTVRFFAFLRDAAGVESCTLDLTSGDSGRQVHARLRWQYPRLAGFLDCCGLAVNCEYRSWETPLREGDELGLIPPVSGG